MIERLTKKNERIWEDAFKNNSDARFQHSLNYKNIIEKTYKNCEERYYLSLKNKKPVMLFPFILVRSKLFGNKLMSVPFLDVGGFLGKYNVNNLKEIVELLKKENNDIEIRLNSSMKDFKKYREFFRKEDFEIDNRREQFIVKITSEEDMWKRFHKHTRNDIRKAMKSGLKIILIKKDKRFKDFYSLYSREMKNFGTPQHSFKFFENLFNTKEVIGFNCYKNKKIIGSLILFFTGKFGYVAFNVSNSKYRNLRPNDLLYWKTIRWAIDNKIEELDLGQIEQGAPIGSRARGLFKFKQKWLGKVYERVYFTFPKRNATGKKNKLKKFRNVWRKIPLPVLKILGPKIASGLGI